MQILNDRQIRQKLRRLAIEVLERNTTEDELIVAGINNNGYIVAQLLVDIIKEYATSPIHLSRIQINPAAPASSPITISLPTEAWDGKAVLVVDDVANTGRTLFYACKPLLEKLPKKLEVAVLVDRKHKSFPILVDYVGLSLATTLRNNIQVSLPENGQYAVHLD